MDLVEREIADIQQSFRYTFGEAVEWIMQHLYEYDTVFKSDFNRFLSGNALAKKFGVKYD